MDARFVLLTFERRSEADAVDEDRMAAEWLEALVPLGTDWRKPVEVVHVCR